jgi:hypothetical protein
MIEYCNENNIEFLVPEELVANFKHVVEKSKQKEDEEPLFKAYPALFKYFTENLISNNMEDKQILNMEDEQILEHITKHVEFYLNDFSEFLSDKNFKISVNKLIHQIFWPNRNLRSPLHLLYSEKKYELLKQISIYLKNNIKDFEMLGTRKQFEYIFKYHLEFDSVSINVYSQVSYLLNDYELENLPDEQSDLIDYYESILDGIGEKIKQEMINWKSSKK